MAEHSSIVGGSSAEKRINCPGSLQMEAKLPVRIAYDDDGQEIVVKESSVYADEGTALHSCIQHALEENVTDTDELVGREYDGFVMSDHLVNSAIVPALDFFDALVDECEEEGGLEFITEARCEMPGIPGAFGTSDIVGRTSKRSVIVDWKFGVGVLVKASYIMDEVMPDGAVFKIEQPNSQPMFYARAAINSFPHLFEDRPDWPVDLYIAQPRHRDGPSFTHYRTTVGELEDFRMKLIRAITAATGKDPVIKRGHWCKFAACKVICPHFTGPAIDLTKMYDALETKKKGVVGAVSIDWSQAYSELLTLAELAEWVIGEIRNQAHRFLEDGNPVPGWKLVPKRASERYVDADGAKAMAIKSGVAPAAIMTAPELVSPAQLRGALTPLMEGGTKKAREEAAKKRIGDFTEKVSSGTTLAPESDARQSVIATSTQLMALSEKLAALGGKS